MGQSVTPTQVLSDVGSSFGATPVTTPASPAATSSFTQDVNANDVEFWVGVSGTFRGLQLKVEGRISERDEYFPVATYTTEGTGPHTAPLEAADQTPRVWTGRCAGFSRIKVTITRLTGGSVNVDLKTGPFFDSPQQRVVVAGGSLANITTPISVAETSRGAVESQDGFRVQRVTNEREHRLLEQILALQEEQLQVLKLGLNVEL